MLRNYQQKIKTITDSAQSVSKRYLHTGSTPLNVNQAMIHDYAIGLGLSKIFFAVIQGKPEYLPMAIGTIAAFHRLIRLGTNNGWNFGGDDYLKMLPVATFFSIQETEHYKEAVADIKPYAINNFVRLNQKMVVEIETYEEIDHKKYITVGVQPPKFSEGIHPAHMTYLLMPILKYIATSAAKEMRGEFGSHSSMLRYISNTPYMLDKAMAAVRMMPEPAALTAGGIMYHSISNNVFGNQTQQQQIDLISQMYKEALTTQDDGAG